MDATASESARKKRVFHPKGAGAAGRMFRSAMNDAARSAIRLKHSRNQNISYIHDEKRKQHEILLKKKDLIGILDDIAIEKKLNQNQSDSYPLKICSSLSGSEEGSICPPISPNFRIKSWLNANEQYVDDKIELSSSVCSDLEESKSIEMSFNEDVPHNINTALSNRSNVDEKPDTESSNSFNLDKLQTESASTVINAFFHETLKARNSLRPSTYEKLHIHDQTLRSETDMTTSTVNSDKIRKGDCNLSKGNEKFSYETAAADPLKCSSRNTHCSTDISSQGSYYNVFDKTQIIKHKSVLSVCSYGTQNRNSAVTASTMSIDSGYLSIKSPTHSTTNIFDNELGKESISKCFSQNRIHSINSNASLDSLDCDYQPSSPPFQNFATNPHEKSYKTQDVMQDESNYFGQSMERRPTYKKQDSGYDTYNECYSVDNLLNCDTDVVSLTKDFDNFFIPPPSSRTWTSNVSNFDTTSDSFKGMMQEFKATKLFESTGNSESVNFNPFLDHKIQISDKNLSDITTTNKRLNKLELKHEKNELEESTSHTNLSTADNYLECSAENLNLISKLIDNENLIPETSGKIFPDEVVSDILSNDDSFILYERQRVLNHADELLENLLQNDTYFENAQKFGNSKECVEKVCLSDSETIGEKTKDEENASFCDASFSELCEVSMPMDHFLDSNLQKDIYDVENVELVNAKDQTNVDILSLPSMHNVPEFDKQLISNLCDIFLDDSKCLLPL